MGVIRAGMEPLMRSRMLVMSCLDFLLRPVTLLPGFRDPLWPRDGLSSKLIRRFSTSICHAISACLPALPPPWSRWRAAQTLPDGLDPPGRCGDDAADPRRQQRRRRRHAVRPAAQQAPGICRPPITTCSCAPSRPPAHGDWTGARGTGRPGPEPGRPPAAGMALCAGQEQRRHLRRDRRGDEGYRARTSAGTWPLRGTLQARAEAAITPDMTPAPDHRLVRRRDTQFLASAGSGWAKRWWRPAKRPRARR